MGAESLPLSTVEYMYRWNRNVDSSTLSSSPTHNFTPLARSDDGTYTCTVTINSTLLNNTRTAMSEKTLTVTRKFVHRFLILDNTTNYHAMTGVMPDAPNDLTDYIVNATSITITWTLSSDIFIDRYKVSYMYTIRRCSASPGEAINDNISDGSARSYNLMSLNEDSTYTITVTAINDEGSRSSTITADTSTSGNHTIISCVVR